jgi:hypothetical protein
MKAVLIRPDGRKRLDPLQRVEVYPGTEQILLSTLRYELVHGVIDQVHVLAVTCVVAE